MRRGPQQGHQQMGSRAHVVIEASVEDVCQGSQQAIPPAQAQHLQCKHSLSFKVMRSRALVSKLLS